MASAMMAPGGLLAGRYEVQATVRETDLSTVYRAHDRVTDALVAIKVLHPDLPEEARRHFRKETALAQKLSHENIVRIHDLNQSEGFTYLTMEWIDGETLADVLAERGQFALADFERLQREFLGALHYVHRRQILHRDIKPLNVMLTREGRVKLLDFGQAQAASSSISGSLLGTPPYVAPDVLAGHRPTVASDIYSCGVMFYELLTGRKPARVADYSRIPVRVAQVLEQCMAPDPAIRYASAAELSRVLDQALTPETGSQKNTLADRLTAVAPPATEAIPILRSITEALINHAGGTIALTPANIMVHRDTATLLPGVDAPDGRYTNPDEFRENAPAGAGLVYQLGFIFYEYLLGQDRFREQFRQVSGPMGWFEWHQGVAPYTPIRTIRTDVPIELSNLIGKMLDRNAEARPKLDEVRKHLVRLSASLDRTMVIMVDPNLGKTSDGLGKDGPPPPPPPPPPPDDPKKKDQRHDSGNIHHVKKDQKKQVGQGGGRKGLLIALVVVLILALALAGAGWFYWPVIQEKITLLKNQQQQNGQKKADPKKTDPNPDPIATIRFDERPPVLETATGRMIYVPAMSGFMIGDDSSSDPLDKPAHPETVSEFYLDEVEVTNGLYKRYLEARQSPDRPDNPPGDPGYFNKAELPVAVSWSDANSFATWAGKRLPYEREWERAAKSATQARYLSDSLPEWVFDPYSPYPGSTLQILPERGSWRIVRGAPGSLPWQTHRNGADIVRRPGVYGGIGFRCVADPEAAIQLANEFRMTSRKGMP